MKSVVIDYEKCICCLACYEACAHGAIVKNEEGPLRLPERKCFMCLNCTLVCPTRAISVPGLSEEELYGEKHCASDEERLVMSRRSVRNYEENESIQLREKVERALRVAQWAPTAKNADVIKWIVVWGHDKVRTLADGLLENAQELGRTDMVRRYRRGRNPVVFNAPCVIMAAAPVDSYDPPVDCAISMTTLELLLNSYGLGTCWLGYFQRLLELSPETEAALGLEEGWKICCAICAGQPKNVTSLSIPWREYPNVKWNV